MQRHLKRLALTSALLALLANTGCRSPIGLAFPLTASVLEQARSISTRYAVSDRAEIGRLIVEPDRTLTAFVTIYGNGEPVGTARHRSRQRMSEEIAPGPVALRESSSRSDRVATWTAETRVAEWTEYANRPPGNRDVSHRLTVWIPPRWEAQPKRTREGTEPRAPRAWTFTQPGATYGAPAPFGSRVMGGALYCVAPVTFVIDLTFEAGLLLLVLPLETFLNLGERLSH